MSSKKATKRALLTSIMALAMCVVMLVGTTFAWFTDTASTSVNKIQAGNLKVDIVNESGDSLKGQTLNWVKAAGHENEEVLWEPGATYKLTQFKIVNKGNLALKYEITINGVTGDAKLLNAINFTVKKGTADPVALENWNGVLLPAGKTDAAAGEEVGETALITITGEMKKNAGNEYQGLSLDGISITVVATQYTYEYDSKDNRYDESAEATINVNKDNIQDYLDGKYGAIDGMTLVLAAGSYDTLELGRATAYEGSNTKYYTFKGGYDSQTETKAYDTAEALKAALEDTNVGNLRYVRSLSNVTFKAADGATVNIAGVTMQSAHIHENGHDYVLGRNVENGKNTYWLVHQVNGIKFEGLNFTGNVNIATSLADTIIDGFTFDKCTFTTNGTTDDKGQAIRYYNELNNGQVKNLVVNNCEFTDCYQGVYTGNICGVTVENCKFATMGHAAISVQAGEDPFDHRAVTITGNKFDNGTAVAKFIRFNKIGADTQITVTGNNVTGNLSGDAFAIKATSVAQGVTKVISNNTWGSLAQDITIG